MKLSKKAQKNADDLLAACKGSDVLCHPFTVGGRPAALVFLDGVADKAAIGEQVLKPLLGQTQPLCSDREVVSALFACEIKSQTEIGEAAAAMLAGDPALFIEGIATAFIVGVKKPPARAVMEPPTSVVIKGPREGFIEEIKTNLSLVRKRLTAKQLVVDWLTVGKYSHTKIAVVYLADVASKTCAEEIKMRIGGMKIDQVTDSSYLVPFLASGAPVKQVGQTEKPDVFAAKLCEGRVGILVDGSPIALTLPYMLLEDLQSAEDYYGGAARATFSRIIRLIAASVSVLLPGAYVAAQLFHLQTIPLKLFLSVAGAIRGIPLSPSLEMLLVLVIFELLTEASVRMPKYVGLALSVVGALVLGDTAVRAGLISTPAILIMAISGISLYTVPDLVGELSVLRLLTLVVAGIFGGYGVAVLGVGTAIFVLSVENYGTPLLAPFAPRITADLKDGMVKEGLLSQQRRPRALGVQNETRLIPFSERKEEKGRAVREGKDLRQTPKGGKRL